MKVMEDNKDRKIKEALLKGTEEARELKDMVWSNIENKLSSNGGKVVKMKKRKGWFTKYAGIAAALAVILLVNTQYGNAAIDEIKRLFEPKKTVEQQIEGTGEKTEMDLKTSAMKYIIYIDSSMYKMESIEGRDIIRPINPAADRPEVSMTIEEAPNKSPEEAAAEVERALKSEFKTVINEGWVSEPLKAIEIRGKNGSKPDDKVVRYYFLDNTMGGSIIIKQQYFLEAAEGHGARFSNMLKEFKIVEN